MNNKNSIVVVAASLAAITFSVRMTAQVPQGPEAFVSSDSSMRREGDAARGIGPDYRAVIDAAAFTYTPALGSGVPATMPWRFELESVRRGGRVVRDAASLAEAEFEVSGVRCDLDRGDGMLERYEALGNGVEQSFVFQSLPGSGDLVVRGRVTSDLAAAPAQQAAALDFVCAPYGGVTLRNVVGIDATGWRMPGTMSWDGEHLDLRLPATFVDRATFPLVLDPLVGSSLGVGFSTSDARSPEVAYSGELNRYLCVWERHFSATDIEIRGRLRTRTNGSASSIFAITSGVNVRNVDPQVCGVAGRNVFVVAWQAGPSFFGPSDILGCTVDSSANVGTTRILTGALQPGVPPTVGPSAAIEIRPSLAGDPEGNDSRIVLAYELPGQGIATRQVAVNANTGALTASLSPQLIVNDPTATRPALSSAANDQIVLAYQMFAGGKDTIGAVRLDTLGVPNGTTASWVAVGSTLRNPDVAGDGSSYRIICEREWVLGDNDVQCASVSWNASNQSVPNYSLANIATSGQDERNPRVAYCGPKFVVSWSSRTGNLAYDRLVRGIGTTAACNACGPTTALPRTRATELYGAIASAWSGGDFGDDRAVVLYTSAEQALAPVSDVRGQLFNAMTGSVGVEFASGCGNPTGLFAGGGTFAVGGGDFVFEASSVVSAPQICLFNFGLSQQTIPCGCTVVVPDLIEPVVMVGGSATYTLFLPCSPALDGFQMMVQTATILSGFNGPCSLLPEASFSAPETWTLGY